MLEVEGTEALDQAVSDNGGKGKQRKRRRRGLKQRKKKEKKQADTPRKKRQDLFGRFVKAARYVRGIGASQVHPSAKIRLFGLLMQAQRGDFQETKEGDSGEDAEGAIGVLQRLKLDAWRANKGTSRNKAMEEYLEVLKAIAPQWRVAHLIGAKRSLADERPKPMMWVLEACFNRKEVMKSPRNQRNRPATAGQAMTPKNMSSISTSVPALHVASIKVLQSTHSGRIWSEKFVHISSLPQKTSYKSTLQEKEDPFIKDMPQNLNVECVGALSCLSSLLPRLSSLVSRLSSLISCDVSHLLNISSSRQLCNKAEFATLSEQRAFFEKQIREEAREIDGDSIGSGWKYVGQAEFDHTKSAWDKSARSARHVELLPNGLDIYSRGVDWSSTPQYRSE